MSQESRVEVENGQSNSNASSQASPVVARKSLNESKKIQVFEKMFKVMYLGASIFSAILLHKVYLFQTLPEFEQARAGTVYDIFLYSIPFAIVFTLSDLAIHYLFDDFVAEYYINEQKYQGKAKHKRAYTIVKWSYSLLYYIISSVVAIALIKDTSFFPTWLGGSGSCLNIIKNAPYLSEATWQMKIFYLIQFGKHFSRLISHMFIRQEGNYYEYVLHHSLSTFLILFSYLSNQWLIGIMVLFCHDISDFFLIIARGYRDYKHYSKKLLQLFYVPAALAWIGGRLVIFPACCVYASLVAPSIVEPNLTQFEKDILMMPYRWMGYMLVALLILQVIWSYYILKAFVSVNVSSKVSNTYE